MWYVRDMRISINDNSNSSSDELTLVYLDEEDLDRYADHLEQLAKQIKSREVILTNTEAATASERWWAADKWEYFRTQDQVLVLRYYNIKFKTEELKRKENWLKENPDAEDHGVTPIPSLKQKP